MSSVTLGDHEVWSTLANKRLQNIYNDLCEFESMLTDGKDGPKLFELLETINEIREHHQSVVEKIEWSKESINSKCNNLKLQMKILETSIDLLKIETNCIDNEAEKGQKME